MANEGIPATGLSYEAMRDTWEENIRTGQPMSDNELEFHCLVLGISPEEAAIAHLDALAIADFVNDLEIE